MLMRRANYVAACHTSVHPFGGSIATLAPGCEPETLFSEADSHKNISLNCNPDNFIGGRSSVQIFLRIVHDEVFTINFRV
jgi:hypothetical protein